MKTRAIKFLIPALAIVFAIAASAFTALETPEPDGTTMITGYIPTGNPLQPCQDVQVDCEVGSTFDCTYDASIPVYQQIGATACQNRLSKPQL